MTAVKRTDFVVRKEAENGESLNLIPEQELVYFLFEEELETDEKRLKIRLANVEKLSANED